MECINEKRPRGRPRKFGPLPEKRPVGRPLKHNYGVLPSNPCERAKRLNNLASYRSKKARRERLAEQDQEYKRLKEANKKLLLRIATFHRAIARLKSILHEKGLFSIWRPWSDDIHSFIKIQKTSDRIGKSKY
jgi:hypothetical protein